MLKSSIAKRLMLASIGIGMLATPAHAQLDRALSIAKSSTAAAAASQQRVEQLDDQADTASREFRAVLQQIENIKLFVDQQQIFKDNQDAEIASLNRQLGSVELVKQGMNPMMLKMVVALEDSVNNDLPFLKNERLAEIEKLKAGIGDPDITPADLYRNILDAFKNEVNYGLGVGSYEGAHPTRPGNVVNFVHFGRTAFIYTTKDESEIARYDINAREWKLLEGADAITYRQATRIAREEAAPAIIYAHVISGE